MSGRLTDTLSHFGIAGGAVYDALVALAAVEHDADLATRHLRAKATYEAVGARVIVTSKASAMTRPHDRSVVPRESRLAHGERTPGESE